MLTALGAVQSTAGTALGQKSWCGMSEEGSDRHRLGDRQRNNPILVTLKKDVNIKM